MCGIFGMIVGPGSTLTAPEIAALLARLFRYSEQRGREAAGIALMSGDAIEVFKRPGRAQTMIRRPAYKAFVRAGLERAPRRHGRLAAPVAAIGHSRLVTNGSEAMSENNQPVVSGHSVGVHNGIVVNAEALWDAHPDLTRRYDVDSEVIYRLIDKHYEATGGLEAAVAATFRELQGAASIAFLTDRETRLTLATNCGSLYTAVHRDAALFLFASERHTLRRIAGGRLPAGLQGGFAIDHLAPGRGLAVDLAELSPVAFGLADGAVPEAAPRPAPAGLTIVDHSAQAAELRRCTRCVLPETFPFIDFDADGVCSVCRAHGESPLLGRAALEDRVARFRRGDGEADCLVAFSGGRDSSYGLHFIKTELGMNPIAFTYDWGMVTDLARRNQARVCGRLGVEHIIRSPDIAKKRRNIRRNLEAWQRRPVLGMIPLLMAGDKQMYRIARELRRETGIGLVVFCAGNELERTEFKTGFCGIRENAHGQVLWRYSLLNKVKLALYYGRQYALNPRYLNRSVADTLSAYWAAYVGRDDFAYLYHYIPWNEAEITATLTREYDWEQAGDTANTWRIGDGTAAFYNYIYATVAGFSEHDTFRANQVRHGLISRDEALRLLAEDNRPRLESMREYAALVGFNLDEALLRINAIPKLYRAAGRFNARRHTD